jgi:NitT/TauT family transport system ATP-binding protein
MVLVTHNITEAATLSHSVLVMRSGRITASIEDSLPRPRDESVRTSAAFGELYRKISGALRGEKNE